jgi:tRNA splicing endonuclease
MRDRLAQEFGIATDNEKRHTKQESQANQLKDTEEESNGTSDVNRVVMVERMVLESHNDGISPLDVLRKSEQMGITMHRNYPYVVLRKLVEHGRIQKYGSKYFDPTLKLQLPLAG